MGKPFAYREDDDADFLAFMQRVDAVVLRVTGDLFGYEDFADATWRDLHEEDPECEDQAIIDTLSDASPLFAAWVAEQADG